MIKSSKSKVISLMTVIILVLSYLSLTSSCLAIRNSFLGEEELNSFSNLTLSSSNSKIPSILRCAHAGDPFTISWRFDSLKAFPQYSNIGSFIFDTLVDYDFDNGTIIPSLARNWAVSNDSKEWLFILREDIWFHDGSKFDANAVKFNYDRFINPSHPAYIPNPPLPLTDLPLESVTIISSYRILFTFSIPYAPFINVHAPSVEIVSPQSFTGDNITNPIGTGPYTFAQPITQDNKLLFTFIRNPNYFRGSPPFDQVQYTVFQTFEEFESHLLSNEADFAAAGVFAINSSLLSDYWNYSFQNAGMVRLGFLNQQKEELANFKVRQALNYAIDKELYKRQASNESFSMFGPETDIPSSIIPHFLPYWDDSIPGYPYNITLANLLLDNAGYLRGPDGYRFNLTIISPDSPGRATLIAQQFNSIGINCSINVLPYDITLANWMEGNYDMIIWGFPGIFDPSQMSRFLHTNGSFNTAGYTNSQMDSLLDLSSETPVYQEREFYFKLIQNIAQMDAPYILLPQSSFPYIRAKDVSQFIRLSKNGRPTFPYSTSLVSEVRRYIDVAIASKPVYFPFVDALVSQSDNQPLVVNISMAYDLKTFLPATKGTGKFYFITNQQDVTYRFRCYYDSEEIIDLSIDQFYQYNWDSSSWSPIEVVSSNSSLRFVEIELPGGNQILSLGKKILLITYKLLPLISVLFGSILFFALVTIFYNHIKLNQYKRRYNL